MTCERAREQMKDALIEPLDDASDAALRSHLETCSACRGEQARLEALWRDLGTLSIANPDVPAGAPVSGHGRSNPRKPSAAGLRVAAAAAILAAGFAVGRWTAAAPVVDTPAPPTHLLLLATHVGGSSPAPSAEAASEGLAAIIAEYAAWADELAREGQLVSAEKLASAPGHDLARVDGQIVVEPEAIGDTRIGGYYLLHADSDAKALEIAAQSPHLKYGGTVHVRPIEETP